MLIGNDMKDKGERWGLSYRLGLYTSNTQVIVGNMEVNTLTKGAGKRMKTDTFYF